MQSALGSASRGITHWPPIENGRAIGIGPIKDQLVEVMETSNEQLQLISPDGAYSLEYGEGTVEIKTKLTST